MLQETMALDQKQPSSMGVLMKRCSENMQQIYRKFTASLPMPKCDFNEVALQFY